MFLFVGVEPPSPSFGFVRAEVDRSAPLNKAFLPDAAQHIPLVKDCSILQGPVRASCALRTTHVTASSAHAQVQLRPLYDAEFRVILR